MSGATAVAAGGMVICGAGVPKQREADPVPGKPVQGRGLVQQQKAEETIARLQSASGTRSTHEGGACGAIHAQVNVG